MAFKIFIGKPPSMKIMKECPAERLRAFFLAISIKSSAFPE